MLTRTTTLILLAALTSPSLAQPDSLIRDITIVDVESGSLIPHRDILIRGDKIDQIADANTIKSDDAKIIDGTKLFVIPGLWDAHTHYSSSPDTFGPLMIAHGITCARDLGASTDHIIGIRDELKRSAAIGPTLWVTGAIIDGDPPIWPFSEPVDTPEEGRAAVQKLKAAGVDMIKVYSKLKPEVYKAIIEEAHKNKLKVTGHIPAGVSIDEAIAAGQDCNEHLQRFDGEFIAITGKPRGPGIWGDFAGWGYYPEIDAGKLDALCAKIAKADMWQCPTIIVMAGIASIPSGAGAKNPAMEYVPATLTSFWQEPGYEGFGRTIEPVLKHHKDMVGRLHRAGVTLMVGSDLSNPYVFAGRSVHEEMAIFQEVGIPPADVLRAATLNPAKFVNADDRYGTIAAGKSASLVLVKANPLEDVKNASLIDAVFDEGAYRDRADLDRLLADVRKTVKGDAPAPDADKVALDLPGEVIQRGRYTLKFEQFDAGSEDYLVTKSDDGWRVMCSMSPKGGMQKPYTCTVHIDNEGKLVKSTYKVLGDGGTDAVYVIEDGKYKARDTASNDAAEQVLPVPDHAVFAPPIYAAEFIQHLIHPLEPGQKREINSVGFGYMGWRLAAAPASVERLPDEQIDRPDGTKALARGSRTVIKTPGGEFNFTNWCDEWWIPYKVVITMPMGRLTIERQ
ncbi:MAG: amidohydrolase family protein [Phycisphaerales bacterium]|nr:amidohydrolase family protein [Phycisphaerales bacterium]